MVAAYCTVILQRVSRAAVVGSGVALLYAYLYTLLVNEDYACRGFDRAVPDPRGDHVRDAPGRLVRDREPRGRAGQPDPDLLGRARLIRSDRALPARGIARVPPLTAARGPSKRWVWRDRARSRDLRRNGADRGLAAAALLLAAAHLPPPRPEPRSPRVERFEKRYRSLDASERSRALAAARGPSEAEIRRRTGRPPDAPLRIEVLGVEPQRLAKDARPETYRRRAEVITYDYDSDRRSVATVDLESGRVETIFVVGGGQLPLTDAEVARAFELVLADPESSARLRANFARVASRPLRDPGELEITGFVYRAESMPDRNPRRPLAADAIAARSCSCARPTTWRSSCRSSTSRASACSRRAGSVRPRRPLLPRRLRPRPRPERRRRHRNGTRRPAKAPAKAKKSAPNAAH